MVTVRHLLQEKGNQVWHVTPKATILDVLRLLDEKDIGAVPVLEGGKLVGIFSERDYARQVAQTEQLNLNVNIEALMTKVVYFVTPDQTIDECMGMMTEKHIRHLPVVDNAKVIGLISIGDVVKEIISDRESTIQGLENYITGREYLH
jgi:CBS domain-containing protein